MVKDVELIEEAAKYIYNVLLELGKMRSIPLSRQKAIDKAADGFRFWQRTSFAELKEAFRDGGK